MEDFESFSKAKQLRLELRDAIARLEDALAMASSASGWRAAVERGLAGVRAALDAHVSEVEGPSGLLGDLVRDAPRLANEVELIKKEHARLLVDTDVILADLADADSTDIREQAMDLLRDLVLHRQLGADLVYEAYMTDIGGQG